MKTSVAEIKTTTARYWLVSPLLIAAALFVYKANSSIKVLRSTWVSGTIAGRPEVVNFAGQFSALTAVQRSVNYFLIIWPALVFGILIGAAVRAFVSPRVFERFARATTLKAQLAAGLAGTPLMLCSCCVAPIFRSVAESSGRLGPALGLMMASPTLNPAALTLTFMLFEPRIAGARLLLSLIAVLLIGPAVSRMFRHINVELESDVALEAYSGLTFFRSVVAVSLRTIPGLVIGVMASMLIVQWLPAQVFASPGAKFAAIVVTAVVAVPLALPTFLEIPLALSLLAAGFPPGAAVALLFAGPAVNLPSLWTVARVSGWKIAAISAALVWVLAVCGGLLIG